MESDEHYITLGPAHILAEVRVAAIFALPRQPYGALTQAVITVEKHLAELCQSLKRVVRPRLCAVTIGPIVVSSRKYERMFGALSQTEAMLESLVTAWRETPDLFGPRPAVIPKIAVVNDKGQLSGVYLPHDVGKLLFLPGVIRHVADQREFKSGAWHFSSPLTGGAAGKE